MAKLIIFKNDYRSFEAIHNVFGYVGNSLRAYGLVGAQNMLVYNSIGQVLAVKKYFYDLTEKKVIHFLIAFSNDDCISPADAFNIGYEVCAGLPEYQIKFCVHQNTEHLHIHFAMNPISLLDGHKFCFDNANLFSFINELRKIFKPYDVKIDFSFSECYK